MKLSDQQIYFFKTFGFLTFPGYFLNEIDSIISEFEKVWSLNGGGHAGTEHDEKRRSALSHFIDQNVYLSSLLDDNRINDAVSSLLGNDFNYSSSDGNFYVGDTKWHSDWKWPKEPGTSNRKYLSIKMAFYLDHVTRETGCLRVIPGSHLIGDSFSDNLHNLLTENSTPEPISTLVNPGGNVPSFALESVPGDVVLFDHSIKHSSWGGSTRRRMFTMNFEERYAQEDIHILKEKMGTMTRFWTDKAYGDIMVKTASPERMRHLEQRLSNQSHLPDLAYKAKTEMQEPSRG